MKTIFSSGFLLFMFISSVWPATYYINSNTGDNQNDGLSTESPFHDFWKLDNIQIRPGDSILFATNSSYAGYFNAKFPGKPNKPVVISSYGEGDMPVFSNPGEWYAIGLVSQYVVIDGLQVHTTHSAGIQIDSSYCVVKNCDIYNTGFGIAIYSKGNRIVGNNIHDLHIIRNTPGGNDDYGAVGIEIEHGGNEIAYNSFINCIDTSYDYGVDGGAMEFFGDIDSLSIHHNYAENCDGFFEVGGGTVRNIEIYYNVLVGNGEIGGFHFKGDFAATVEGFRFVNNTVYDLSTDQYEVLWFNGNAGASEVELMNNIIVFEGFSRFSGENMFNHHHNLYWSPTHDPLGITLHETERLAQPGFVSAEENDFSLAGNSPAINAGGTHSYSKDYTGNPIIDLPDLGAFESQLTSYLQKPSNATIKIYPNPSDGIFYISEITGNEWILSDAGGRIIRRGNGLSVDLRSHACGIYFLNIYQRSFALIKAVD